MNVSGMANAAQGASKAAGAAGAASKAAGAAEGASKAAGAATKAEGVIDKGADKVSEAVEGKTSPKSDLDDKLDKAKDATEKIDDATGGGDGDDDKGEDKPEHEAGEKAGVGKVYDENGQEQDSSTKKTAEAAGRVIARVYGGEAGGQAADAVAKSGAGGKVLGAAADVADKTVPGLSKATEELDKAGVADAVNNGLDTYEKFKSGDIQGAMESAEKTKENLKKTKKAIFKYLLIGMLPTLGFVILIICIYIVVIGPIVGGFLDIVDSIESFGQNVAEVFNEVVDVFTGGSTSADDIENIIANDIPNFDSLSTERKNLVVTGLSAIGKPYKWGGKPTGPGYDNFPSNGLDCSGFVQWVYWTAIGDQLGNGVSTGTIYSLIGTVFEEISEDELQPGDVGLKEAGWTENNHTGIYVGNGQWVHEANERDGCKISNYGSFTIFLRYKGIT